jgi:hypothetical protein
MWLIEGDFIRLYDRPILTQLRICQAYKGFATYVDIKYIDATHQPLEPIGYARADVIVEDDQLHLTMERLLCMTSFANVAD